MSEKTLPEPIELSLGWRLEFCWKDIGEEEDIIQGFVMSPGDKESASLAFAVEVGTTSDGSEMEIPTVVMNELKQYYDEYAYKPKILCGNSLSYHSRVTRKEISNSFWVHYNPRTREFKAGQGTTRDLSHRQLIKHSSKEAADSLALALSSFKDNYTGFISMEVTEKTTFELAP